MRVTIREIFEEIDECAADNKAVANLLKDLLKREMEEKGSWQYKEVYKLAFGQIVRKGVGK